MMVFSERASLRRNDDFQYNDLMQILRFKLTWKRYLQSSSATIALSTGKRPILFPPISMATLSRPRAINRNESVCCWSCGLSKETRTLKTSRREGRPYGLDSGGTSVSPSCGIIGDRGEVGWLGKLASVEKYEARRASDGSCEEAAGIDPEVGSGALIRSCGSSVVFGV